MRFGCLASAFLLTLASPARAQRISEMPAASAVTGAEQVPIVQDGANRRANVSEIVGQAPVTVGGVGHTISQWLASITAGTAPFANMNISPSGSAGQAISVTPTGNSTTTLSTLNVQGTAKAASTREFMVNLGFTSALGGAYQGQDAGDKVALYTGMDCLPGSGNCWSMNPLAIARPGFAGSVQTLEADLANFSDPSANTELGSSNFRVALAANGATVSGSYNTAGVYVGSVNSNAIWRYGVAIGNNSVLRASIFDWASGAQYSYLNSSNHSSAVIADLSTSPTALLPAGTYSLAAIECGAATAALGCLRLGNNQGVTAQNAAGTANLTLIKLTPANTVEVGVGSGNVVMPSIIESVSGPPASSTSPCITGQHTWDASYEYRCVASNTWKRAALTAW